MVSLLFIANNPAVDGIKSALQQVLKIRIDSVADFDHGLKDVFEKRPSIVCIQEQIQGVTGESVARHIQMLLGSSAPTFIVVYETGSRIKPIKGLFEHLIDLNQAPDKVMADMIGILKSLLGSSWELVSIAPKPKTASERAAAIVPVDSKEFADKLVDDLISDLDSFGTVDKKQSAEEDIHLEKNQELSVDDAAALLIKEAKSLHEADAPADTVPDGSLFVVSSAQEYAEISSEHVAPAASVTKSSSPVVPHEKSALTDIPVQETKNVAAAKEKVSKPMDLTSSVPVVEQSKPEVKPVPDTAKQTDIKEATPIAAKPADFAITKQNTDTEDIPEDLLLEFEKNFRTQSASRSKIIALSIMVVIVCAGVVWYVVKKKPVLVAKVTTSKPVEQPAPAMPKPAPPAAVTTQPASVASVQNQRSSHPVQPVTPQAVATKTSQELPSFIPAKGLDKSYPEKKPGWERYVGSSEEFRLFRADGKIKALQVLSRNNASIPDARFTSILKEMTGDAKLTITSNEKKLGFMVGKGVVSSKAEVLVYRKKGAVRAFVISLN